MVGLGPKILSTLSCESKKFKGPVYVIKPQEVTTERMRSILGVDEEGTADELVGVKVGKMLKGATIVTRGETRGEESAARASRRSTRNSAAPIPSSVVSLSGDFVVNVGVFNFIARVCVVGVPVGVRIAAAG